MRKKKRKVGLIVFEMSNFTLTTYFKNKKLNGYLNN